LNPPPPAAAGLRCATPPADKDRALAYAARRPRRTPSPTAAPESLRARAPVPRPPDRSTSPPPADSPRASAPARSSPPGKAPPPPTASGRDDRAGALARGLSAGGGDVERSGGRGTGARARRD